VYRPSSTISRRAFALIGHAQGLDDVVYFSFKHTRDVGDGHPDAVVGYAVIGEVVGAYLFGSVAGAHLRAAFLTKFLLALFKFHLVQARAKHLHGLNLVLQLAALVLASDHNACRDVREAHGGVCAVYSLTAMPASAVDVGSDVFFAYLEVYFLGFGHDQHRGCRGVD